MKKKDPRIELLKELREGRSDMSMLKVNPKISEASLEAIDDFKDFLEDYADRTPDHYDLSMSIDRRDLVETLQYANNRNCLGVQYCFGFDRPVKSGGRMRLVSSATMHDHPDASDDYVYDSDFLFSGANGEWVRQPFLDLHCEEDISEDIVSKYTGNFRRIYEDYKPPIKKYRKGSLLPVKALLKIFTDPMTVLGTTDMLTIKWGLVKNGPQDPIGNFTIIIGIGDLTTGPVIERKDDKGITDPPGDCPPRNPC